MFVKGEVIVIDEKDNTLNLEDKVRREEDEESEHRPKTQDNTTLSFNFYLLTSTIFATMTLSVFLFILFFTLSHSSELQSDNDPTLVADRERHKGQMREMDELQPTLGNREQLPRALKVEEPLGDNNGNNAASPQSGVVVNWQKSKEGSPVEVKKNKSKEKQDDDKTATTTWSPNTMDLVNVVARLNVEKTSLLDQLSSLQRRLDKCEVLYRNALSDRLTRDSLVAASSVSVCGMLHHMLAPQYCAKHCSDSCSIYCRQEHTKKVQISTTMASGVTQVLEKNNQ